MAKSLSPEQGLSIFAFILILLVAGGFAFLDLNKAKAPGVPVVLTQYDTTALSALTAPDADNVFLKTLNLDQPAIGSTNGTPYNPEELGKTDLGRLGQ